MGIGIRRPLCCFCWLLVLSVALFLFGLRVIWIAATLVVALLCAFVFTLFALKKNKFRASGFYAAFLCLAIVLSSGMMLVRQAVAAYSVEVYAGEEQIIHASVLTREYSSNYRTGFTVRIDRIGEKKVNQKAYLECDFLSPMQIGDAFEARVMLENMHDVLLDQSIKRAHLSDGCVYLATMVQSENCLSIISGGAGKTLWMTLRMLALDLQGRLSYTLSECIGGEEGDLCAALLLGDKQALEDLSILDFRRSGASHLLALSGLHLSILTAFFSWLLLKLRIPFAARFPLTALFIFGYLFLTGCSISTLRASVMLLYLLIARRSGRGSDSLTSLSLFFATCVLLQPYMLFDAGLWLSSLAAFVLVGVIPALSEKKQCANRQREHKTPKHALLRSLGTSLLIMIVLVVPMWLIFGEIAVLSPISTVILTPLVTLVLAIGPFVLFLHGLGGAVITDFWCGWLSVFMRGVASYMLRIVAWLSDFENAVLSLRFDFCDWLLPLFAIVFAVLLLVRFKRKWLVFLAPALLVICFAVMYVSAIGAWEQGLVVEHASKGNSEALLISHGDQVVLCDIGDGGYGVCTLMMSDGVTRRHTELDGVLLTHYHNKHISYLQRLFASIKVRTLYLPLTMELCREEKAQADEGIARRLLELAREYRVEVCLYRPDETVAVGKLCLQGLHYEMLSRSEHPAIAMTWCLPPETETPPICATYIGSAALEAQGIFQKLNSELSQSRAVILGGHGPLIKQKISITDWSDDIQYLIISHAQTAAALELNEKTQDVISRVELAVCEAAPVEVRILQDEKSTEE